MGIDFNCRRTIDSATKQAQRIKTNTKRGLGDWEKEHDVDVSGTVTSSDNNERHST